VSNTNEANSNNNNKLLPEPSSGFGESEEKVTNNHDKRWRLSMHAIVQNSQSFVMKEGQWILTPEELERLKSTKSGAVLKNLREQAE
jgi:hypothetical protein